MWVERFGLDVFSGFGLEAFAAGFVLVALGPSFRWDDGSRQNLSPHCPAQVSPFNFDPSGRKTGAHFC